MRRSKADEALREARKQSLLAAIGALPATRDNRGRDTVPVSAGMPLPTLSIVRQAARERRLTLSSYVKRAAYAFAAYDLGIPVTEVLGMDPRVTRETGHSLDDADGSRFGAWQVENLLGKEDQDA